MSDTTRVARARRALLMTELVKASAALQAAFTIACDIEDLDLAHDLREQGKAVAAAIGRGRKPELTLGEALS